MAKSRTIRVMLSSRCNDLFPLSTQPQSRLSTLRAEIKKEVENVVVLGRKPFEVWINEDAVEPAELDAWDVCIRQANDCDVFVMLYNGNAGWIGTAENASIGICHAEFEAAYARAPDKIAIIDIFEHGSQGAPSKPADKRFQERVRRENRFGPPAKTPASLKEAIRRSIVDTTISLAQKGVFSAGRGRGYLGPALDWRRLNYGARQVAMIESLGSALAPKSSIKNAGYRAAEIEGKAILFCLNAIPDSMSVAEAREMVGQPHLKDVSAAKHLSRLHGGPVHLIACHKGATETQAKRMLGFADATFVPAPFGIYVIDPVQAIQLVLIANCADANATRHGVQRFIEWLPQSAQSSLLIKAAKKRKSLITALSEKI